MTARQKKPAPESQPIKAEALGGVIPYLQVKGASAASEFYQRAFGAIEVYRMPADDRGRTMHIHLHLNGGSLMLNDAYPEHGHALTDPQSYSLMLPVQDIDTWWDRAIEAGGESVMPVQLMFWGDRYGQLRDPFGVLWAINAPAPVEPASDAAVKPAARKRR